MGPTVCNKAAMGHCLLSLLLYALLFVFGRFSGPTRRNGEVLYINVNMNCSVCCRCLMRLTGPFTNCGKRIKTGFIANLTQRLPKNLPRPNLQTIAQTGHLENGLTIFALNLVQIMHFWHYISVCYKAFFFTGTNKSDRYWAVQQSNEWYKS